jgi:Tetracyclin repressor-like, C-terminal domain
MQRAVERGEVTSTELNPRIIALPIDLIRHEALMTLKPIRAETIIDIVDSVFLPLVNPRI